MKCWIPAMSNASTLPPLAPRPPPPAPPSPPPPPPRAPPHAEAVNRAATRQPLYAARTKIFPKRATGNFRNFKWLVMLITLGIYYVTPWLRWTAGPTRQTRRCWSISPNRRFYFFFIEIWPQEFFIVAGMLVMAGIGLFLITSTVAPRKSGCGYTLPADRVGRSFSRRGTLGRG